MLILKHVLIKCKIVIYDLYASMFSRYVFFKLNHENMTFSLHNIIYIIRMTFQYLSLEVGGGLIYGKHKVKSSQG